MKKNIFFLLLVAVTINASAQTPFIAKNGYSLELERLNEYLKTFDNGYYGYFEVKDGYIFDRFKAGKYDKFKMEDIEGAIIEENYKRVIFKCKYGACISTDWKENGKEEYIQFVNGGTFNYQELATLLNNFRDAYWGNKKQSPNTIVTSYTKPTSKTVITTKKPAPKKEESKKAVEAKINKAAFKKGSKITWDVIDDGFSGFFTIVFTAVTTDSICFNWSVAEISEPVLKGSVKIGKSAIGSATKFESDFLKDNGKKFTSMQNGVVFFLSNFAAKQLLANQPADIQFLPDAKLKCKLIKENKFRLSPEDAKTFITQYECADENEMPFSFINNYNIPVVTSINIKTATFSLMSIKL